MPVSMREHRSSTRLRDWSCRTAFRTGYPDMQKGPSDKKIAVIYADGEISMLEVCEIECFIVEDEKTFALYDGKKHLVRKRLYELENELPGDYERISKSAIANWKKISKFKVQLSGAVDAVFKSGYVECISRRCFAELKRRYGL